MDEWFKARLIWHEGIEALSDAEAGRLAKALWKYAATGEVENLSGGEKFAFAMCMATLRQDMQKREELSEARSEAGKKGGRPRKANESKKSHKDIRYKNNIPPYNPPTGDDEDDDELLAMAEKHNAVFDRAHECGFDTNTATLNRLTDLIAVHGPDAVMAALDECVEHNAKSLAYLRKVLDGKSQSKVKADRPNDYTFL